MKLLAALALALCAISAVGESSCPFPTLIHRERAGLFEEEEEHAARGLSSTRSFFVSGDSRRNNRERKAKTKNAASLFTALSRSRSLALETVNAREREAALSRGEEKAMPLSLAFTGDEPKTYFAFSQDSCRAKRKKTLGRAHATI